MRGPLFASAQILFWFCAIEINFLHLRRVRDELWHILYSIKHINFNYYVLLFYEMYEDGN